MRKWLVALGILGVVAMAAPTASAASITLVTGVDTAPNAYGSAAWPGFRDAAYANLVAGTFVNQANSTEPGNIGTLNYAANDVVVTSFGDLGKRLHAFYYVPGETIVSLAAANFQVRVSYEFDGVWYDAYQSIWTTPGSWINYGGGVVGSMGMAYWGAYGFNSGTPEALAALAFDLADVDRYAGGINFQFRWDGGSSQTMATHPVPEPATLALLGLGLVLGAARLRRRRL